MTRLITLGLFAALVLMFVAVPAAGASDHTCADYPSQAAAQAALSVRPQLDRDRDGIACENNPAPYSPNYQSGDRTERDTTTTTTTTTMRTTTTTMPTTTTTIRTATTTTTATQMPGLPRTGGGGASGGGLLVTALAALVATLAGGGALVARRRS